MIMSPAAPVLDPAMVYALPPLDHKTWLHPTTAPVPSRSQPNLAWLQLPITPSASSLVSPLEPPSSATLPSLSHSISTPPAPSMSLAPGPLPATCPASWGNLAFPIVRGDPPTHYFSRSCNPPPPPSLHRFHPYSAPPGVKRSYGPPMNSYPPYVPPLSAATTTFAHTLYADPMSLPPLPQHLPPPPVRRGRVLEQAPGPATHGVPNTPGSAAFPPAAVLPRHPELVAHAAFAVALEAKRKRIMQWALEVSSADACAPEVDTARVGSHPGSARSIRGTRSKADDEVFQPSLEDDAAVDAAARRRRLDD